jgi:hypothetical protein
MVGSIGAIMVHVSYEKMLNEVGIKVTEIKSGKWKATGSPHRDLSEEELGYLQDRINGTAQLFYDQMVQNRPGVDRNTFDGSVYLATEAVTKGMLDGVQSFDRSVREIILMRPKAAAPVVPDYHTSGVSAADSTGEVEMKNKKKAMTKASTEERREAAIAAGADPDKVDELLAAEGADSGNDEKIATEVAANADETTPDAETKETEAAEGDGEQTPELTLEDATAQIDALQAEVTGLTASVEQLTSERDAAQKAVDNQSELLAKSQTFMVDRLSQMRLALGLTKVDFSDMAADAVLREYESTNKMFSKAFNLAEAHAVDGETKDVKPDNKTAASVTSLQKARLRAAGLK